MLGTIIFIILVLVLTIKIVLNEKQGILLYVIFSLVSPNFSYSGIHISFEIVGFFIILFVLFLKRSNIFILYKKWPHRQRLWIYFFLVIISSLLAVLKYNSSINWVVILAYFRIICIIYMLCYVFRENSEKVLDNIISPVIFINFIVAVIQLTMPNSVQLFYDFYYKASLTPLREVASLGYFNRAYGTFGTPVLLGVFSLISFAIYLGYYVEKRPCRFLSFKILISITCGLLALSKTAILGIPLLILVIFILGISGVIKIENKKALIIPFLVFGIFSIVVKLLERAGFAISWYLKFIGNPIAAFETRYSEDNGILNETYQVILDNLIIGVGPTIVGDVFIGDSMYVNILYISGCVGLLIYGLILISALRLNLLKKNVTGILGSFTILLAGLAAPIQLNIISASLVAYIFYKAGFGKISEVRNGLPLIKTYNGIKKDSNI